MRRTRIFASGLFLLLGACDDGETAAPDDSSATGDASPAGPQLEGAAAEMYAAMDPNADPCQDFYRYACGGWLDNNDIPDDRPANSRIMGIVDRSEELLRGVLEDAAKAGDNASTGKVGNFYAACMDEAAVDKAGVEPLKPALDQIAKVKNLGSAYETSARLSPYGLDAFFSAGVQPDLKRPKTNLLTIAQGGLGLPNRDFYLREDESSKQLLSMYEQHIAQMLPLIGDDPEQAKSDAHDIVALETELARVSKPLAELRDVDASYNRLDQKQLKKLTPKIKWSKVFAAAGNPKVEFVNVATPDFFSKSTKILAKTKPETLRAYMRWHLASGAATHLSSKVEDKAFEFRAALTGQQALPPRWKLCVQHTVAALPEAVGELYVDKAFAGDGKKVATDMIVAVERAFEAGLAGLSWMDDVTQKRAVDKVAAIRNKIGFPDKWRDYGAVDVKKTTHFANVVSASEFALARDIAKADKPVDPDEWFMPPSMLNAYANPPGMEMVFPAGILQPPLFSTELPMAVNFGAMGSIMGHELTHHFDDQGRKFNASGELEPWWEPDVMTKFEAEARCVSQAYDAYEVAPGLNVNGEQTLGENIADIGGLKAAHAAYVKWAETNPEESPIPGLSAEQLLFVAFSQNYCGKMRPEMEKVRVLSDVHSPGKFRAVGGVSNNAAFWQAFSCAEDTPMHPKNACGVW